jgi:drug/metabolite transporter (DMT)-like permease
MGYLFALLASALFGANGSVTKVVIEAGLTPLQLTLFRVLGTAVIAALLLLATNRRAFRVPRRTLLWLAVLGVTGVALLQATYAAALQLLPVGITLLIEYTASLMVALVAFFFLGERVRPRLWIAIGCVLAGLAVVAQVWSNTLNPVGVILAFAAAITLTIYFILGERQVSSTPPLVVAFWTMTFAALFWTAFSGWWAIEPAVFTHPVSLGGTLSAVVVPVWVPLLWNIVLGTFAPFWLSFQALKRMSATAAGIIATSEVIFAFAFAWFWLRETLNGIQIAGAAVVLVGIVLAQTSRSKSAIDADLALPMANISSNVGRSGVS